MSKDIESLDMLLDRDVFLRNLVRELSGTLEDVVGLDEASGFISIVGQHIGEWMNTEYCAALGVDALSASHIPAVLVDLKRRIQGDFSIDSVDDEKIVLSNRTCPFGDKVKDRPSLCMMTSNVFGTVAAENVGYAKVCLNETIARGDNGCKVVVYLRQGPAADKEEGNEYYRS